MATASARYREKELELRFQFRFRLVDLAAKGIDKVFSSGTIIIVAYLAYRAVLALAGKLTLADFAVKVLGFKPNEIVAYVFGAGGVGFGLRAQRLRRNQTERTAQRIAEMEQRLDPNRTSSGLTPRGLTHPEDKQ